MNWGLFWIGVTLIIVIGDIIAKRTPGATLSEHLREWIKTKTSWLLLAGFMISLYFHIVPVLGSYWPVEPIIAFGAGIVFFATLGDKVPNLRLDKWLGGAIYGGITAVITGGGVAFFSDGKLSGSEIIILAGMILSGLGGWIVQHKDQISSDVTSPVPPVTPSNK